MPNNIPIGKTTKTLFVLCTAFVLSVVIFNFYKLYLQKDYEFLVETSCELGETCFVRDCSGEDECPPTELESYRLYAIKASEFSVCSDGDCTDECLSGSLECREIRCDASAGDSCQAGIQ